MDFYVGDRVLIIGDCSDATDHLDGKFGKVIEVNNFDIKVTVDGEPYTWWIWNYNARPLDSTGKVIEVI